MLVNTNINRIENLKQGPTYALITVLASFALLTLFLSSSVIFDWFGIRVKEGNYVLFVVWANFVSSIIYLASSYGIMKSKAWSYKALGMSAIILIIALIGLFIHINSGGLYEIKTVGAMFFRIGLTLVFAFLAYYKIEKWN